MTSPMEQSNLMQELSDLASAVRLMKDPQSIWAVADATFDRLIGHRMFTVLRVEPETGDVRRLYTSNSSAYPVGGSKKMGPTPWGKLVLEKGQPFVGKDADAIRWAYPDHETIIGLGLESALNVPMCLRGKTLGTLNLTHNSGHYDERHLPLASLLAAILTPVCTLDNCATKIH